MEELERLRVAEQAMKQEVIFLTRAVISWIGLTISLTWRLVVALFGIAAFLLTLLVICGKLLFDWLKDRRESADAKAERAE